MRTTRRSNIKITHNGCTYETLQDIATKYNIVYNTLHRAVKHGVDITKYLDYLEGQGVAIFKETNIVFRGKIYKNVLDIIRSYRIAKITAIVELQQGIELENVITRDVNYVMTVENPIRYNNKQFKSLSDLAVNLGLHYSYLQRIYLKTKDLDFSVEKAKEHAERKRKLTRAKEIFK